MDPGLVVAVALAVTFAVTIGLHDASNAIATRAASPGRAIVLASVFNLLGPFVLGAAVADTIGGIVSVSPSHGVGVIGAGLASALTWNVITWRLGIPSSFGNALVGGLVGASLLEGGIDAVNWGGMDGIHPVGFGTPIALAVSPVLGALSAFLVIVGLRRVAHRATRRWAPPVRSAQWVTAAAHGSAKRWLRSPSGSSTRSSRRAETSHQQLPSG